MTTQTSMQVPTVPREARRRRLGTTGPTVASPGLGLMGMSGIYGASDHDENIATIHAALDAGVTLLDTGDFDGMGKNELLLRDALKGRDRSKVVISVKYGALRDPGHGWGGVDTRPAASKNFVAYSLQRLGTDQIDVYRPARLDPNVPIEETVGGLAEMVEAGWIRHIGLSEVGSDTLRRAHAVHPIADLQIEYSLASRGIEDGLLETCRELGVGITAYGVLSRGLLSGHWSPDRATGHDFRAISPRFRSGNVEHNLELVERLRTVADDIGVTVAQLAIAWVDAQGQDIIPIIGARRRDQLGESLGAASVVLDGEAFGSDHRGVPPRLGVRRSVRRRTTGKSRQRARLTSALAPYACFRARGRWPTDKAEGTHSGWLGWIVFSGKIIILGVARDGRASRAVSRRAVCRP